MKGSVPLRHLAVINRSVLPEDTDPLLTFKYIDISQVDSTGMIDMGATEPMSFHDAPSRARRLAPAGATIVSTVRTYLRAIAQVPAVGEPLVFSTGFAVLEPKSADPRYFSYACRSTRFVDEVVARSTGVSYPAINPSELGSIPLPNPPVEEQRRIADFLDDRVARIDQIIAGRCQQVALLDRAAKSEAAHLISTAVPGPPLSALARIIDTEHKTAPSTPHGGYWIAGTNAIREGVVVPSELREIDADAYGEWTVRGRPQPGDVLLTREAPVGQVALLSDQDTRIAIGQRVVLLQPRLGVLDPAFLRLVLMYGALRPVIEQASAGSLHPHLNMADISRLRIPDIAFDRQVSIGCEHEKLLERGKVRSGELSRQVALLQEYRQSLITAAVTGELDVTTASSRIPE